MPGPNNQLPDAEHIEGLMPEWTGEPRTSRVELQYTDQRGQWHSLQMSYLDALYLLNMLEQMSTDLGTEQLRRSQNG